MNEISRDLAIVPAKGNQFSSADDPELVERWYRRKFAALVGERVVVVGGDLISQRVDALVNPCDRKCPCSASQALAIGGDGISARWVFQTAVPDWNGGDHLEDSLLASAWGSCLALAAERGVGRIAFPALGCGCRGFPLSVAASVAATAILFGLLKHPTIERALIVCREPATLRAFRMALEGDR